MEQIVKKLNWYYYGIMVLTLIVLSVFYYMFSKQMYEPLDPMSQLGTTLQYAAIFLTLAAIPLGLYLVKWTKPQNEEKYLEVATMRILMVGLTMPVGIAFFYLMGGHRPMMWLAAIGAIAWYFTKPTIGKMEKEMTPEDPNMPTY